MNYSEIKQKETKRQNLKKVHQKVKLDCVYPH